MGTPRSVAFACFSAGLGWEDALVRIIRDCPAGRPAEKASLEAEVKALWREYHHERRAA